MPASQKAAIWRVVATQRGYYNQRLIEMGEVFELLAYEDGTYPVAQREIQLKDEQGKPRVDEFGEFQYRYEQIIDPKSKEPVHEHYAEDRGPRMMKRGPKRGETVHLGWMRRVPNNVPVGLYVNPGEANAPMPDFWNTRLQLPPPMQYAPGAPPDPRRVHAPVLQVLPPVHADEADEAA